MGATFGTSQYVVKPTGEPPGLSRRVPRGNKPRGLPSNPSIRMSRWETDILGDLIHAKRECLLQLHDLGRRQRALIDDGDLTGLLDLLAAKQKPLSQLQRVERALDPFRRQDHEQRTWRTPEARARCAAVLQQCAALLAEVMHQEKYCEEVLLRRREEAASRLQGAHLAGQARQAYRPDPTLPISQVDLSSEQ